MQIEELKAARVNVERFVAISDKFTDLQELNAEILRTFISNIVIHERTNKLTKISEQHIYIYLRYIGCLGKQMPNKPYKRKGQTA